MRFDRSKEDLDLRGYLAERDIVDPWATDVDLFRLAPLDSHLRDRIDGGFEFWSGAAAGQHNLLKGALPRSAKILFVSEGHMKEAFTRERGYGLDGVFKGLGERISFVYNGIRAERHRPEKLSVLESEGFQKPPGPLRRLRASQLLEWKVGNRLALQRKLGFEENPNHVVLGFVTRIVKQKGLNILMTRMPDGKTLLEHLLDMRHPNGAKVQIPIFGTSGNDQVGQAQTKFFREFLLTHSQYEGQFIFIEKFDKVLAKQIGAGSDLMGMFSIDEPGGIANQELALLLAMVIATNRGGLQDFKHAGGTPLELVDGFEIDDTPAAHAQRVHVAGQILKRVYEVLSTYHDNPDAHLDRLASLPRFRASWGHRAAKYVTEYMSAIRRMASDFLTATELPPAIPEPSVVMESIKLAQNGVSDKVLVTERLLAAMRDHRGSFKNARVLDLTSYGGAPGIYAALLGAREVVSVNREEAASADVRFNAQRWGVANRFRPILKDISQERIEDLGGFDVILFDPPPYYLPGEQTPLTALVKSGQVEVDEKGRLLDGFLKDVGHESLNLNGIIFMIAAHRQEVLESIRREGFEVETFDVVEQKSGNATVGLLRVASTDTQAVRGAAGFWRWIGISNLRVIGFLEGVLTGLYSLSQFRAMELSAFSDSWSFSITGVTILATGYAAALALHFITGVITSEVLPAKRLSFDSVKASAVAMSGFVGMPLVLGGVALSGVSGAGLIITGVLAGATLHAWINGRSLLARTDRALRNVTVWPYPVKTSIQEALKPHPELAFVWKTLVRKIGQYSVPLWGNVRPTNRHEFAELKRELLVLGALKVSEDVEVVLTEWGKLPVDQKQSLLKVVVDRQHQLDPERTVVLYAGLQKDEPIRLAIRSRRASIDRNVFRSIVERHALQRYAIDRNLGSFFKIFHSEEAIQSVRAAIPGQSGRFVTHTINLARALRPGGGGASTICTLCAEAIQTKFINEVWVTLGTLRLYFNNFSVWPALENGGDRAEPHHIVAAWGNEHVPQGRLTDAAVLKELRTAWMTANRSVSRHLRAPFRMMLNGWNYGDPVVNGGASQDHVHSHWVRKAFDAETAVVNWRTPAWMSVQVGFVRLLPGTKPDGSDDHFALAFEAPTENGELLDRDLAKILKAIASRGHSFNLFYFEKPAPRWQVWLGLDRLIRAIQKPRIRVFVTGRKLGRPAANRSALGAPQILGLENAIEDFPGRFYALTAGQEEQLSRLDLSEQLTYLSDERRNGRLAGRPSSELLADYREDLQKTSYGRSELEALLAEQLQWVPAAPKPQRTPSNWRIQSAAA